MNRKKEYIELKAELDNIPSEVEFTTSCLQERIKSKQRKSYKKPVVLIIIIISLCVISISVAAIIQSTFSIKIPEKSTEFENLYVDKKWLSFL